MSGLLHCPECNGQPLGVEIRGVFDGVLFWKCEACGLAWNRLTHGNRRAEVAQGYIDASNAGRVTA